jgi:hypothetical protein
MNGASFSERYYELCKELIETNRVFIEVFCRAASIESLFRWVKPTVDVHNRRDETVQCEACFELP